MGDPGPGLLRLRTERLLSGAVVVTAVGEIDISTAGPLREALEQAAADARPGDRLVLDLTHVGFLDSTGLGALNAARLQAEGRGLAWRLCGLRPPVARLLDLTGVAALFPVHPDVTAAVTADRPFRPGSNRPGPD